MWRGSLYGHNLTSALALAGQPWLDAPLGTMTIGVEDSVQLVGDRIDLDLNERFHVYEQPDGFGFEIVGIGSAVASLSNLAIVVDRALEAEIGCDHVLATFVIPRVLVASGLLALHAAGIVVGGRCVAIVGDTEVGKSSLAAEAALRGMQVLSDDCLVFDRDTDRIWPGERTMRPRQYAMGSMTRAERALPATVDPVSLGAVVVVTGRGPRAAFTHVDRRLAGTIVHQHAFVSSSASIGPSLRRVMRLCPCSSARRPMATSARAWMPSFGR
jgi:hypothetical protein